MTVISNLFFEHVLTSNSFPQLDLDASGIVEFSELSDTGGNVPSNEKIDEVSMKTAIEYVTEKGNVFNLVKAGLVYLQCTSFSGHLFSNRWRRDCTESALWRDYDKKQA